MILQKYIIFFNYNKDSKKYFHIFLNLFHKKFSHIQLALLLCNFAVELQIYIKYIYYRNIQRITTYHKDFFTILHIIHIVRDYTFKTSTL